MIAQEFVIAGGAFVGEDGEVRHVYSIGKPGNGYCVLWDSLPRPANVTASLFWYQTQRDRPHGVMPMRKFQKWAVSQASPTASTSGMGGES
jgi:hypothetical protein